jgi:uncharacterized peroxidase-related enzyme
MARVRDIEINEVADDLQAVYHRYSQDYGPFLNQVKVFAHRAPYLRHIMGLMLENAESPVISKKHSEICVLVASMLNDCDYCVAHHAPRLSSEGLSLETVEQILRPDCPGLDEVDTLVRDYAVAVTNNPGRIRDAMFENLRRHFSEEQIVELTLRPAQCGFFNKVNDALMIEMEDGVAEDFGARNSDAAD